MDDTWAMDWEGWGQDERTGREVERSETMLAAKILSFCTCCEPRGRRGGPPGSTAELLLS